MSRFITHNQKALNMDHVLYFYKSDDYTDEERVQRAYYIVIQESPRGINTEWGWQFKNAEARDSFFSNMIAKCNI